MRQMTLGTCLALISIPAALAAPLSDSTPFDQFTIKQITLPKKPITTGKVYGGTGVTYMNGSPIVGTVDFKSVPFCTLVSAESGTSTPDDKSRVLTVTGKPGSEFNSIAAIGYEFAVGSLFVRLDCWFYGHRRDGKPRLTLGDIRRSLGSEIKVDAVPATAKYGSEGFSMTVSPAATSNRSDSRKSAPPPQGLTKPGESATKAPDAR